MISTRDFSTTLLQTSGEVPTPRFGHRAALVGTTLLICGGQAKLNKSVPNHDSLYLLNLGTSDPLMSSRHQLIMACAPESREWTRVVVNGPGPGGSCSHTTTVVGSKLFVFGGRIDEKTTNDMWTLDLKCLKSQLLWESYEPTPGNEKPLPRSAHVSVTTEDSIIIYGGYSDQHFYNDTWSFDISTRKWIELQCTGSIPSPRAVMLLSLSMMLCMSLVDSPRTTAFLMICMPFSCRRTDGSKFPTWAQVHVNGGLMPWLLTGHVSLCWRIFTRCTGG
ncbi:hypothetical protein BGY98DRAFT_705863 [Russula aff. rugulosa BPL654]|nr:hypothetical protein BGY98DRAFT_705863 [Russula aff. rugulosa BPL654]